MDLNIALIVIIALNAIVSYKGFTDKEFFRKYEFHIGSIRAGEQYRMVTSAFLHADIMHLGLNMFTLYMFAPIVIYYLGIFVFNLFACFYKRNPSALLRGLYLVTGDMTYDTV